MDMRSRRELTGRRRLLSVRTHVCFRGGERQSEPAPSRLGRYRDEVAAGLAAADAVIAPTQALLDVLEEIYQVDFHGLVIRNGIDPKPFRACDKVGQILSVGRVWDEAKNIALLDSIAPEVAWPILIAGDAASPVSNCRSSFSHVRLLGKLNHSAVCQEMSRTAIYAAPAWYEPFGLAVLEAALSRCALILADIPTFRELWQDAAMLIEPSDARCWKAAFSKMLEDGPREVAGAARKRALALNRQLMSSSYYLYRELSESSSPLRRRVRHENSFLWLKSSLVILEWCCDLLPRDHSCSGLRGHDITFYEPDAYDRQKYRDIELPPGRRALFINRRRNARSQKLRRRAARTSSSRRAVSEFSIILDAAVLDLSSSRSLVAYWDVDAPATLERAQTNTTDKFRALIPAMI